MAELTDHELLLGISDDVKDIKESVSGLRKTVYGDGNGNVGLVTKYAVLSDNMGTVRKIITFVGGPMLGAVVIYLFGLLVK